MHRSTSQWAISDFFLPLIQLILHPNDWSGFDWSGFVVVTSFWIFSHSGLVRIWGLDFSEMCLWSLVRQKSVCHMIGCSTGLRTICCCAPQSGNNLHTSTIQKSLQISFFSRWRTNKHLVHWNLELCRKGGFRTSFCHQIWDYFEQQLNYSTMKVSSSNCISNAAKWLINFATALNMSFDST